MMFDPNYPIELHTDASSDGYGAILMHKVEGKNRVVEYYSKRTSPAESRYHSYELETLAVVNAVKHFRHYLHGRKFLVVTDCNSLKASSNKVTTGSIGGGPICRRSLSMLCIEKAKEWLTWISFRETP
jgi:hypothetical protein